jgi:hypothetical protein
LGASVYLIPYPIHEQLGLGELQPTTVTLKLADKSLTIPHGELSNVFVRADKALFPVDFIVLDMEPSSHYTHHVPIILGRPFLAMANVICRLGIMVVIFANMTPRLNIFKASNLPPSEDEAECFSIDVIDDLVEHTLLTILTNDHLERALTFGCPDDSEGFEATSCLREMSELALEYPYETDQLEAVSCLREMSELIESSTPSADCHWLARAEPLPSLPDSPPLPSIVAQPK